MLGRVTVPLPAAASAFEHRRRLFLRLPSSDCARVLVGFVDEAQLADHFLNLVKIRPHLRLVSVEVSLLPRARTPDVKLIHVEERLRIRRGLLPRVPALVEHWCTLIIRVQARLVPLWSNLRRLRLGSESEVRGLVVRQRRPRPMSAARHCSLATRLR